MNEELKKYFYEKIGWLYNRNHDYKNTRYDLSNYYCIIFLLEKSCTFDIFICENEIVSLELCKRYSESILLNKILITQKIINDLDIDKTDFLNETYAKYEKFCKISFLNEKLTAIDKDFKM